MPIVTYNILQLPQIHILPSTVRLYNIAEYSGFKRRDHTCESCEGVGKVQAEAACGSPGGLDGSIAVLSRLRRPEVAGRSRCCPARRRPEVAGRSRYCPACAGRIWRVDRGIACPVPGGCGGLIGVWTCPASGGLGGSIVVLPCPAQGGFGESMAILTCPASGGSGGLIAVLPAPHQTDLSV